MLNQPQKDPHTEIAVRQKTALLTRFDDDYMRRQHDLVAEWEYQDWLVDEQGRQSFPASDPPGNY